MTDGTSAEGDFGSGYFEAGAVRRSRPLTRSLYESLAFSWAERHEPRLATGAGRRALEIGCGFGYVAELLAERGYRVLATDVSPFAIERARGEIARPEVELLVWDATRPPPFPGGFDLVVAFEVVEHLVDPDAALRSWRSLLAPGGALLVTTPNRHGPASRHWRDPTHVSVRGAAAWRRALAASGPWASTRVGAAQAVPYAWRVSGRMRLFPLPLVGAALRLLAIAP